jgi:alkylated DNA nucleotide flippase Atl1
MNVPWFRVVAGQVQKERNGKKGVIDAIDKGKGYNQENTWKKVIKRRGRIVIYSR